MVNGKQLVEVKLVEVKKRYSYLARIKGLRI
jgi:hypothetical protein